MNGSQVEPGELRRAIAWFVLAGACLCACSVGMTADSEFGGQNAVMIGALLFIPWGLSALASILFLLNLGFVASAALRNRRHLTLSGWLLALRYALAEWPLRAITGRWHPDYRRIAALEAELGYREPGRTPVGLPRVFSAEFLHRILHEIPASRRGGPCHVCECEQYAARSR